MLRGTRSRGIAGLAQSARLRWLEETSLRLAEAILLLIVLLVLAWAEKACCLPL